MNADRGLHRHCIDMLKACARFAVVDTNNSRPSDVQAKPLDGINAYGRVPSS